MEHQRIRRLLPEAYRAAATPRGGVVRSPALAAILEAMEALHAPAEDILSRADEFVDPHRAPDRFAIMLASWLDLDRYLDWTSGRKGRGRPQYAAGLGYLRNL